MVILSSKEMMNIFIVYLKDKRWLILINLLIFGFFTISFYLYRLPIAAVIYPYIVCIAVELVFFAIGYTRYRAKHTALQLLKRNINITGDIINSAENLHEQDYIEIVKLLIEQRRQMQDNFNSQHNDITQYYTVWAHQIKTPIASMRLSLQKEDSKTARKLTSDLYRVEQYVQMVMAYIRINSVSTDYIIAECELDSLIKQAVKGFSTEFIEKRIAFIYEPIDIRVVSDERWFLFVLEQIISNSLKYTQQGYIKIYLQGSTLCIEDSGIGIAADDLPRIFENGYTGAIGRIEKKSSGIGLYLCKTICGRLNFNISASSQEGKGTTIMIDLGV